MTPLGNKKLEPGVEKMPFDIQSGCRAFFCLTFSDEGDGQKCFIPKKIFFDSADLAIGQG